MKQATKRTMSTVTAALVAAAVVLATAAPVAAGRGEAVERPWRERTTGVTNAFVDCSTDGTIITCGSQIDYQVRGTHVGRATLTATGQLVIDLSKSCEEDGGAINTTDEVIEAPDGSKLFSRTVYFADCDAPLDAFTATRTVTGGTGRFAGATGSMTLVGTNERTDVTVSTMTGRGTITY